MKQIIQEVLQAEENVSATLKEARARAAKIRAHAENEVSEQISAAKTKAQEIVHSLVEQAKTEAQQIKEQRLKQFDENDEDAVNCDSKLYNGLIDDICQVIINVDSGRDA